MEREFLITENDYESICSLVYRHSGIVLSTAKRNMVYSRLVRRLRQLKLTSFKPYCELLESGEPDEITFCINALTTNLTAFFREPHHFDLLRTQLVPCLAQEKSKSRRLRIWSAGCSIGAEPYSIAMVLKEALPDIDDWDVKILATDLDTDSLAVGQRGVFQEDQVVGVSPQRLHRWFHRGTGANAGLVRILPELKRLIAFRHLNLIADWPMRLNFDFIFCRNVVIYFDKPTQHVLFDRFADLLTLQGYMFIGHSESLFKMTDRFELLGKTVYRRCR